MSNPSPQTTSPRLGCLGLLLALLLFVGVGSGLTFITAGLFAPVFVIALVIFVAAACHYVAWGWWLPQVIHEEEESRLTEGTSSEAEDCSPPS